MGNEFIRFDWPFYGRPEGGKKRVRMRAWEGVLAGRPYACALTTVSMTGHTFLLHLYQSTGEVREAASGMLDLSKCYLPRKRQFHELNKLVALN